MKTPREIILAQHRDAEAKLQINSQDLAACAREALAPEKPARRKYFSPSAIVAGFWAEAILPWKRAWLGFAAVWVAIVALAVFSGDTSTGSVVQSAAKTDPQTRLVLLEQQQMLAQLLGPMNEPRKTPAPTTGPRSDLRVEEVVV